MLEMTYAHLLASSAENARVRMDEFMAATEAADADSEEGPRADQSR